MPSDQPANRYQGDNPSRVRIFKFYRRGARRRCTLFRARNPCSHRSGWTVELRPGTLRKVSAAAESAAIFGGNRRCSRRARSVIELGHNGDD